MKFKQLNTLLKQITIKFRAIKNKLEGSLGAKSSIYAMKTLMADPRFDSGQLGLTQGAELP